MVTSDRDFAKCLIEMKEKMHLDIYPFVFHENITKGVSEWGLIDVYKLNELFYLSNYENRKRSDLMRSYITPHLIQKDINDPNISIDSQYRPPSKPPLLLPYKLCDGNLGHRHVINEKLYQVILQFLDKKPMEFMKISISNEKVDEARARGIEEGRKLGREEGIKEEVERRKAELRISEDSSYDSPRTYSPLSSRSNNVTPMKDIISEDPLVPVAPAIIPQDLDPVVVAPLDSVVVPADPEIDLEDLENYGIIDVNPAEENLEYKVCLYVIYILLIITFDTFLLFIGKASN